MGKKPNNISGEAPGFGAIFMSNRATKEECFEKKLFGLPSSHASFVRQVKAGMLLFLFEYEKRELYGVFQACSDGEMNLSPNAFSSSGSKFPAQIQFRTIWYCTPLPEGEFRAAIRDNYFTGKKFNFGLSKQQVRCLLLLFSTRKLRGGPGAKQWMGDHCPRPSMIHDNVGHEVSNNAQNELLLENSCDSKAARITNELITPSNAKSNPIERNENEALNLTNVLDFRGAVSRVVGEEKFSICEVPHEFTPSILSEHPTSYLHKVAGNEYGYMQSFHDRHPSVVPNEYPEVRSGRTNKITEELITPINEEKILIERADHEEHNLANALDFRGGVSGLVSTDPDKTRDMSHEFTPSLSGYPTSYLQKVAGDENRYVQVVENPYDQKATMGYPQVRSGSMTRITNERKLIERPGHEAPNVTNVLDFRGGVSGAVGQENFPSSDSDHTGEFTPSILSGYPTSYLHKVAGDANRYMKSSPEHHPSLVPYECPEVRSGRTSRITNELIAPGNEKNKEIERADQNTSNLANVLDFLSDFCDRYKTRDVYECTPSILSGYRTSCLNEVAGDKNRYVQILRDFHRSAVANEYRGELRRLLDGPSVSNENDYDAYTVGNMNVSHGLGRSVSNSSVLPQQETPIDRKMSSGLGIRSSPSIPGQAPEHSGPLCSFESLCPSFHIDPTYVNTSIHDFCTSASLSRHPLSLAASCVTGSANIRGDSPELSSYPSRFPPLETGPSGQENIEGLARSELSSYPSRFAPSETGPSSHENIEELVRSGSLINPLIWDRIEKRRGMPLTASQEESNRLLIPSIQAYSEDFEFEFQQQQRNLSESTSETHRFLSSYPSPFSNQEHFGELGEGDASIRSSNKKRTVFSRLKFTSEFDKGEHDDLAGLVQLNIDAIVDDVAESLNLSRKHVERESHEQHQNKETQNQRKRSKKLIQVNLETSTDSEVGEHPVDEREKRINFRRRREIQKINKAKAKAKADESFGESSSGISMDKQLKKRKLIRPKFEKNESLTHHDVTERNATNFVLLKDDSASEGSTLDCQRDEKPELCKRVIELHTDIDDKKATDRNVRYENNDNDQGSNIRNTLDGPSEASVCTVSFSMGTSLPFDCTVHS